MSENSTYYLVSTLVPSFLISHVKKILINDRSKAVPVCCSPFIVTAVYFFYYYEQTYLNLYNVQFRQVFSLV